jgi:hypothetical protein
MTLSGNMISCTRNIGGVAGYAAFNSSLTNCYSTASITSSGLATSSNTRANGIVGYVLSGSSINNCYYLTGKLTVDGAIIQDSLFSGTAYIDGGGASFSTPPRTVGVSTTSGDDQRSGAKTATQMKPSLTNAQNGSSMYYGGTVTVNSVRFTGWDFNNVWTIDITKNDGYPILRSSLVAPSPTTVSITGKVSTGTTDLANVKISYTTGSSTGSVMTNASGNYTITVPHGSTFTITAIEKSGYVYTGQPPFGHYVISGKVYNFTMEPGKSNTGGYNAGQDDISISPMIAIIAVAAIGIGGGAFLFLRKR